MQRHGILHSLITDLFIRYGRFLRYFPPLKRYHHPEIVGKVHSDIIDGLAYKFFLRIPRLNGAVAHNFAGQRIQQRATKIFQNDPPKVIYGFDTAMHTLMVALGNTKNRPMFVQEQCIAPRATWIASQRDDQGIDPAVHATTPDAWSSAVEQLEWQLADVVVCPSSYVRDELIAHGCDRNKIELVPYGFDSRASIAMSNELRPNRTLRVVTVGTVGQRKGFHDIRTVAQEMVGQAEFHLLGAISVSSKDAATCPSNMHLHGPVPFDKVVKELQCADVYFLPSYHEGSATSVYEAMAYGLPCITTRQAGSPIRNGEGGWVHEAGDIFGFLRSMVIYKENQHLIIEHGKANQRLSEKYSISAYGDKLANVISNRYSFFVKTSTAISS